jgi:hypothetical protein
MSIVPWSEQMGFNHGIPASNIGERPVNLVSGETARLVPATVAPRLTERIRERPLLALGIAGLAGFVAGGGASSRFGRAMLMLIARLSLKQAASGALAYVVNNNGTIERNRSG